MKKLKLNTAKLQLKKSTIVSLTSAQMRQVYGGETGPCTTYPCETGGTAGCPITASQTPDCCGGEPTPPSETCESLGNHKCDSDPVLECVTDPIICE